jgi:TonB family protein
MPPLPPAPQDPHKLVKVEGGIIAGQIINKTQPRYPQSAKDAHISGAVVLHAIIDETGKVQQLAIVSSPDKSLSQSAIEAVQQWTYRPYLLNGNPTSVDTTITVNYSFASGSTNAPPGPVFPSGQSELKPVKGEAYKVHALYKVRPDSWQDELDRQTVRDAHISGSVVMHVLIDETGKVAQISVLSSPDKSLNEPSMNSVRKWAYEPYVVNGKPIAVESTVTVNYSSMYAQSRSDAGLRQDKPKLLTKVDPIYPRSARVNSVKGEVVLGVVVGATGKVNSVRTVSSPDAELSAAAMDAVKQWTFQPAQRDGVAVATTIPIAVNFNY